jgi:PRTRC genetic system ThiF family protein
MMDELFRMHSLLTRLEHPGLAVQAWDGDEVSAANVGRQRFWPCDIGWNKAEILVTRYNSFGETNWAWVDRNFKKKDCEDMRADVLISCVDSPEVRVMIGQTGRRCRSSGSLWLDTGNDHNSGQVILGHLDGVDDDDPNAVLLPNVLDLYPSLKGQQGNNRPSCSTEEALQRQDFGINQRVAAEASGLLWQLVRYGQLDRHGSFIYQETGDVLPLGIDEEQWKSFAA